MPKKNYNFLTKFSGRFCFIQFGKEFWLECGKENFQAEFVLGKYLWDWKRIVAEKILKRNLSQEFLSKSRSIRDKDKNCVRNFVGIESWTDLENLVHQNAKTELGVGFWINSRESKGKKKREVALGIIVQEKSNEENERRRGHVRRGVRNPVR